MPRILAEVAVGVNPIGMEGKTFAAIGDILGRTVQSCAAKFAYEGWADPRAQTSNIVKSLEKVPPSVLIERDVRANAPRSLSALFFGDPPQGYSALDRMGGQ